MRERLTSAANALVRFAQLAGYFLTHLLVRVALVSLVALVAGFLLFIASYGEKRGLWIDAQGLTAVAVVAAGFLVYLAAAATVGRVRAGKTAQPYFRDYDALKRALVLFLIWFPIAGLALYGLALGIAKVLG